MMDHPNIAKVLDAGATDAGRPLLRHGAGQGRSRSPSSATRTGSPPRERLELFVPVCQAIQHAHQKGVIHRDIKPSNVLVALYDGKPVPKVIDFGVAKAIGQQLTDEDAVHPARAGGRHARVHEPRAGHAQPARRGHAADVYSLGVLLYELLTGTTPLDRERLRAGRAGRDAAADPRGGAAAAEHAADQLAAACWRRPPAYRKSDSQKLPRLVRGELDWIVMKALEKDRTRRYETANGLATDVQRYLKDEPVEACPPTLGYRLRKFAGKNKVAFATTGAVAAALVVGHRADVLAGGAGHERRARRPPRRWTTRSKLGRELDTRLGEINAANAKIRRDRRGAARQPVRLGHADAAAHLGGGQRRAKHAACSIARPGDRRRRPPRVRVALLGPADARRTPVRRADAIGGPTSRQSGVDLLR